MSKDVIEFVSCERVSFTERLPATYEFRESAGWHWLQRLCLAVLHRLGCNAEVTTYKVERHVIGKNGRDFMGALYEQRRALFAHFNQEPCRLLIGAEDYAELMHEMVSDHAFSFMGEYHRQGRSGPTVCGLKVDVVPWIRGMVVTP